VTVFVEAHASNQIQFKVKGADLRSLQSDSLSSMSSTRLGLLMSQKLIEKMGGNLTMDDTASSCCFSIALSVDSSHPTEVAHTALQQKRILVIEPNSTIRQSLTLQAQRWGMVVRSVDSATQALNQLYYERFDGIVLTLQLIEQNLITEIQQHPEAEQVPIVCLLPLNQSELEGNKMQGSATLKQPIRAMDFYHTLAQVL
jgi:CheY-like chemotaxis protein